MHSPSRFTRAPAVLATTALLAIAAPSAARQPAETAMPTSGIRAELIRDIEDVEGKFLGLADAMTGRYDWQPGEGVRSVGEVFMHIAGANLYIPVMAGVQPPETYRVGDMQEAFARMQTLEQETDEAEVKAMLRRGFAHAKHAVAAVPEDGLDTPTQLFGQDATNRAVLTLLVTHMHEHLGQSIAYARMNGVVPPWSAGGGN